MNIIPTWPVARYILSQRDRLAPRGVPIRSDSKRELARYFSATDIDRARLVEQDPLPLFGLKLLEIPYSMARVSGWKLVGPAQITAITLDHVIATRQPMSLQLLFHELVHVVQFRLMGVDAFAREYALGFLRTRDYDAIPIERTAFELEARFAAGLVFDAEAEIARSIEGRHS